MSRDVHRTAIDLIERELARSGCDTSTALAAHLAAILTGHRIRFAEALTTDPADWRTHPTGTQPSDDYRAARAALHPQEEP